MATNSSFLAWRIPMDRKPGGLQSLWSHTTEVTEHTHRSLYLDGGSVRLKGLMGAEWGVQPPQCPRVPLT